MLASAWKWIAGIGIGIGVLVLAVLSFGALRYGWLSRDPIVDLARKDAAKRKAKADGETTKAILDAESSIADRVAENKRLAEEHVASHSLGDTLKSIGVESREPED